jgi:predicted metal-binding protein
MKCKFGCTEYGRGGACPPNTPSVAGCERFFGEYGDAVILHFEGDMDKPEDRHAWSAKINAKLIKLEREVFLAGDERAF